MPKSLLMFSEWVKEQDSHAMQEWVKGMILFSTFHLELFNRFATDCQERVITNLEPCASATRGLTHYLVTTCIWFTWDMCLRVGSTLTQFGWWYLFPAPGAGRHHRPHSLQANLWVRPSCALSSPNTPWHPWPGPSVKALILITVAWMAKWEAAV